MTEAEVRWWQCPSFHCLQLPECQEAVTAEAVTSEIVASLLGLFFGILGASLKSASCVPTL